MKSIASIAILVITYFLTNICWAADTQATQDNISNYQVDIGASPVSAGGLVGLSGSAITNIQTAQDLVVVLNPSVKSGYGLAITPARTSITPMSGQSYFSNSFLRLLGATTLSYAENATVITGANYKKTGASLDTTFYINHDEDPIVGNYFAFVMCLGRKDHEKKANLAASMEPPDAVTIASEMKQAGLAQIACIDKAAKDRKWNASKLALSYGAGWITPDSTPNTSLSLGRTLALSGVFDMGGDNAAFISIRHTKGEVDLNTLAGTPSYSGSTLTAIRFTQNSSDKGDLRWLVELSNANTSSVTVSNSVFKSAIGLDKKLSTNAWLEFRFGRKRTEDGTTIQNTSLLNLNWSPSSTLFSGK